MISSGAYGFEHVNAADQRRHPDSLLNWSERMIRMRKEVPEIGWGDFAVLKVRDPAVLALRYDWRGNSVVVVHNLDAKPREIRVDVGLPASGGQLLSNLLADSHSWAGDDGKHCLMLEGYAYRWFRVGGRDDLLKRDEV